MTSHALSALKCISATPQAHTISRIPALGEHLLEDMEDRLPVTSLSLCEVCVSRGLCLCHVPCSLIRYIEQSGLQEEVRVS